MIVVASAVQVLLFACTGSGGLAVCFSIGGTVIRPFLPSAVLLLCDRAGRRFAYSLVCLDCRTDTIRRVRVEDYTFNACFLC
jgi:hypothetical protein